MIMKPLTNIHLFENRVRNIAKHAPKIKLKGRGNLRYECPFLYLSAKLKEIAPNHCATVIHRGAVNGYGKLGFMARFYVSDELFTALEANRAELATLEDAAEKLVAARMTYMAKSPQ